MKDISRHTVSVQDIQSEQPIVATHIEGMWYLPSGVYEDERGFFTQVAEWPLLDNKLERPFVPKQYNHAHSQTSVMRGFHIEPWNKLVYLGRGVAFCALLDLRPDSSTYLTLDTLRMGYGDEALTGVLYIPNGVANSVCVVDGPIDYFYLVDKLYSERSAVDDVAIDLFDADIAVAWPISPEIASLSERDTHALSLEEFLANRMSG